MKSLRQHRWTIASVAAVTLLSGALLWRSGGGTQAALVQAPYDPIGEADRDELRTVLDIDLHRVCFVGQKSRDDEVDGRRITGAVQRYHGRAEIQRRRISLCMPVPVTRDHCRGYEGQHEGQWCQFLL